MAESLSKLSEKCKICTKVDECDNKRMELNSEFHTRKDIIK